MEETARRPARTPRPLRLLCYAAICAVVCVWIINLIQVSFLVPFHSVDFDSYYTAAHTLRFHPGATIYFVSSAPQAAHAPGLCVFFGPELPPYLYPSFLAIALEPFTSLSCASAATIWFILNILLWALATLILADLLARRWPARRLEATTVAVVISLCFLPAMYGLSLGQVHLVVLVGIVSALWLMDHDRPWLAGGALAVITAIKVLPALLILYYLARGRFRLAGGAAIVGAALFALMLVVSGPQTLVSDAKTLLALSSNVASIQTNEALTAVLPHIGWVVAGLAGLISFGVSARRSGDEMLGACWMLCVMLLLSPLVWSFYLLWLTPTFCAWLAFGPFTRVGWRARGALLLFAALFFVMAFPLSLTLRPFATLALWGITAVLYWRSSERAPTPQAASVAAATGV